ncbi:acylphosphatase [Williamsia phyllosphaerae]|uniref:Acylphosphatase n=2 Tax=Williamsia phyllosphaerae TaxID=885042 RepID=A0ABQ1V7I9_9NOCA|nr:acylphosphatase [Williamsia phyllosphaerae]
MRIERSEDRSESGPSGMSRLTAWVHGHVQGVGFRWWTRSRALELGLVGYAANQADGRVLVVAEGTETNVHRLLDLLRSDTTPGTVDLVVEEFGAPVGDLTGFAER